MTSWASCSSWEPPRRPDSRRKPAPPNRPGLPDTFCTARPYRKWAGLLVQNRYFWFKMDFWCKAPWPFFLSLFTRVRGIGILRSWTAALRSSEKLAPRFGWWRHACCGGDIPRWLKWESPVVDLFEERSPD